MKQKQNKLISLALDFVSFLKEQEVSLDKTILFGSVVSENFDKESDIDIFIESEEKEEKLIKLLGLFEKTRGENWRLKGVGNRISLKIGRLKDWPKLRRSIQGEGILIYSRYNEIPEEAENYVIYVLKFDKLNRAKKVSVWRKLYGYTQKIKSKKYSKEGIVKMLKGRRIEKNILTIPANKSKKFSDFLNMNKIGYKLIEIWADSFALAKQ